MYIGKINLYKNVFHHLLILSVKKQFYYNDKTFLWQTQIQIVVFYTRFIVRQTIE